MIPQRLVEHSKEIARFAPVKPAVKAGIRAAIATMLPIVVSSALRFPGGLWLSVGGFNTSFADKGGSYRTRALSMGAGALMGALGVTLGGLVAEHPTWVIPVTVLFVTACSFGGIYGSAANLVGNTTASAFVIAIALPPSSSLEALQNGACVVVGGLWAMLLSLVLWPIRPYRPARLAIGRSFLAVSDYAGALGRVASSTGDAGWQALIQEHHGRIREALEAARATLAATRRGRGERQRGERLLVLLEIADAMFMGMIALGEDLESLAQHARTGPFRSEVERVLSACSRTLADLARTVETEGRVRQLPALDWDATALREALAHADAGESMPPLERARLLEVARLVAQLREFAGAAVDTAARLSDDPRASAESARPGQALVLPKPSLLGPLRENLSFDSMVLRHALRVGITTTVAVAITTFFRQNHGYWVTITVLTIMQPYTGPTFLKALQRVLGTVVGGLLAIAVASWLHDPYALIPLVFITAGLCVAVIPVNYGLFTVFVTLTFVLLAEMTTGDWSLAEVRMGNTLIGGALALAGTWLLWERSEQKLFPTQMATALRADGELFRLVISASLGDRKAPSAPVDEARRKLGLAALNAEASFQRLLSEPRRRTEPLDPLMTLLVFSRRFAAACITLASTELERVTEQGRATVERFARTIDAALGDVADAVAQGRAPAPLPSFAELPGWHELAMEAPLFQAQLDRIARQLTVLHGAASRRGTNPSR